MSPALEELSRVGLALREVFAQERRAISALDVARLEELAAEKSELADRLSKLREPALATEPQRSAPPAGDDEAIKELLATIRIEAQATAMLASAASQTVRAMLGYESGGTYNRRAERVTSTPIRHLATY